MKISVVALKFLQFSYEKCNKELHCSLISDEIEKSINFDKDDIAKAFYYLENAEYIRNTSFMEINSQIEFKFRLTASGINWVDSTN